MMTLEQSIEALYRVFARYPRPKKIEFCPCGCTKAEATAHLVAVDLRDLDFAAMGDFAFSAIMTQGSLNDFRYLLPRLLDGIAHESFAYNPEILFGKLAYAKWLTWPPDEIAAVRDYLQAFWRAGLRCFPLELCFPAFVEIETLLCSIARTGEPLGRYLQVWSEDESITANEHLVQLVTIFGEDIANRKMMDGFWADATEQAVDLRAWLLSVSSLRRVEANAHLVKHDGLEHLFEPALEVLRAQSRLMS